MIRPVSIPVATLVPARLLSEAGLLSESKWRILILTIATFAALC